MHNIYASLFVIQWQQRKKIKTAVWDKESRKWAAEQHNLHSFIQARVQASLSSPETDQS